VANTETTATEERLLPVARDAVTEALEVVPGVPWMPTEKREAVAAIVLARILAELGRARG
jgi:hypothetical protein